MMMIIILMLSVVTELVCKADAETPAAVNNDDINDITFPISLPHTPLAPAISTPYSSLA